jgi:ribosomal protein S18 acetylase RimI-like enzyme
VIVHDNARAKAYLDARLGIRLVPPFVGYVIVAKGETTGAVVFNSWTLSDVQMTAALGSAVSRRDLRSIFGKAFGAPLDVCRVSCVTRHDNHAAIRRMRLLGFVSEGVAIDYFGHDNHGARYVLLRRSQTIVKDAP